MSEGTITSYILELGGLLGDYEKVETCAVEEQVEKLIIEKARELVEAADGIKKSEMPCNGVEEDSIDGAEVMKFIERCGRVCYQSEKNITEDSAEKFVRNLITRGHESVLEHFSCTFKIICDRGVMAELTRHRLASFSIESTRFNDYSSRNKFSGELTFIKPNWKENIFLYQAWENFMIQAEEKYLQMRKSGAKPEDARAILPNSLKTEIIMTANLREWRHILKLRTDKAAHPQMREVAEMILKTLKEKLPIVFEDIGA